MELHDSFEARVASRLNSVVCVLCGFVTAESKVAPFFVESPIASKISLFTMLHCL
jgi:hypothetical protein